MIDCVLIKNINHGAYHRYRLVFIVTQAVMALHCNYCGHEVPDNSVRKLMSHLRTVHHTGFQSLKELIVRIQISG